MKKANPRVILYTTSQCSYCRQLKALLRQLKVPFSEFDVSKNRRAFLEFQRLQGRGVPLVVVGEQTINGYRPDQLKSALKKAGFDV
ncbi:MAG: NrdH-redoxin [Sedimenticola sp.]|jgi:glutaredoxin|nr:MAG: NrdH-redoxin [Sedimenticola sp.]